MRILLSIITIALVLVGISNAYSPNWGEEWSVDHLKMAQAFFLDNDGDDDRYEGRKAPVGNVLSRDVAATIKQEVYWVGPDDYYAIYVYGNGGTTVASVEPDPDNTGEFIFISQGSLSTFFNDYGAIAQRDHNHEVGGKTASHWTWIPPTTIPQWIKDSYPHLMHLFPAEIPGRIEHRHGSYGSRHSHKVSLSSYRHTAKK